MRPLRYSINITLDGCCDHQAGSTDEELHRYWAESLAQADALLFGRVTYEMMEAAWRPPAQAGARPDWMEPFARTIDAAKKYVVSSTLDRVKPPIHMATKHRIFTTSFASVYPHYVAKAEKKGRTKSEVDAIICWLTGYHQRELEGQLEKQTDFETFFKEAPKLNPSRALIKGTVCGVRVEDIQEPTMREIRYLDKLVDELAKGKAMDKILRA